MRAPVVCVVLSVLAVALRLTAVCHGEWVPASWAAFPPPRLVKGLGGGGGIGKPPPPPPRARHEWRRAQKILLQRTTSKSHIGEPVPMALCDIHVAGCGEHPPAWGL